VVSTVPGEHAMSGNTPETHWLVLATAKTGAVPNVTRKITANDINLFFIKSLDFGHFFLRYS
jgi:hypothetical protein